jgi:alkanesulfonate monooxygenase SsuD/methylene tetrahydromethanopterin reductase-like flavin-dependent oxidoreductase (luciferase family)
MRSSDGIGLNYAFGSSRSHDPGFLRLLVQTVEDLGFSPLWMPEHVVSFRTESYNSKYPCSNDGAVPWQGNLNLHDPLMVAAVAQHTTTLRFGSSEHRHYK